MNAPSATTNRTVLTGLIAALILWGIYLAVGATGYFGKTFDPDTALTKSLIVLGCMTVFLGFWGGVLAAKRNSSTTPDESQSAVSLPSVVSFGVMLAGVAFWFASINAWDQPPPTGAVLLGWLSMSLMGIANVAALIGLSDPRRRKAKFLALISLLIFVTCVIVFFVRSASPVPTTS